MFNKKKLTRRKIEHILDWARAVKAKYIWNGVDQKLENYLRELKRKLK